MTRDVKLMLYDYYHSSLPLPEREKEIEKWFAQKNGGVPMTSNNWIRDLLIERGSLNFERIPGVVFENNYYCSRYLEPTIIRSSKSTADQVALIIHFNVCKNWELIEIGAIPEGGADIICGITPMISNNTELLKIKKLYENTYVQVIITKYKLRFLIRNTDYTCMHTRALRKKKPKMTEEQIITMYLPRVGDYRIGVKLSQGSSLFMPS